MTSTNVLMLRDSIFQLRSDTTLHAFMSLVTTTKVLYCGRQGLSRKSQHLSVITTRSKQDEEEVLVKGKVLCKNRISIEDRYSSLLFLPVGFVPLACIWQHTGLTRAQGNKFLIYSITDVQIDDPVHKVKTNKENWKHNPRVLINIAGTNAE